MDKESIKYFRKVATKLAEQSTDRSTKTGAVIVGSDGLNTKLQIMSTGYNTFPRGIVDNVEARHERPIKYLWTEHAERNAIYEAAENGTPLKGTIMLVSCGAPCADCARAIINSGIKELYCKTNETDKLFATSQWSESINIGIQMLSECGVTLKYYDND